MGVISRDLTNAPTLSTFFLDDAFITGVEGPLGSGKSVACCLKMMRKALEQTPDARTNIRRSRWAIIRNTAPMLKSTTIKTWLECFPEAQCGPMRWSAPISHHIRRPPGPNGEPGLDMEVLFLALDQEDDINKLKSLDLTGAWVNEACDVPAGVIDMLTGRVGRFPTMDPTPPSWRGIFADTNASDEQNWWHLKFQLGNHTETIVVIDHDGEEIEIDIDWHLYRQPPALLECSLGEDGNFDVTEAGYTHVELHDGTIVRWRVEERFVLFAASRYWYPNPFAENRKFLLPGYYAQQVKNKALAWIQRFMQCKLVMWSDGKPWVPEYSDSSMGARRIKYDPNLPLLGGIDIGGGTLNPAAVFAQRGPLGDWRMLKELSIFDIGLNVFTERLNAFCAQHYPNVEITFYLDPAAGQRDPIYKLEIEEHLRNMVPGHKFLLAPTNIIKIRREAMAVPMNRQVTIGDTVVSGFMVDPGCVMLRAGLAGKWSRRRIKTTAERYADEPEKTPWSHVCDAAGYVLLGGGEHSTLIRGTKASQAGKPAPGWGEQSIGPGGRINKTPTMGTDFNPRDF